MSIPGLEGLLVAERVDGVQTDGSVVIRLTDGQPVFVSLEVLIVAALVSRRETTAADERAASAKDHLSVVENEPDL